MITFLAFFCICNNKKPYKKFCFINIQLHRFCSGIHDQFRQKNEISIENEKFDLMSSFFLLKIIIFYSVVRNMLTKDDVIRNLNNSLQFFLKINESNYR